MPRIYSKFRGWEFWDKQGEGHVSRRSLEVQDRFWRADVSGICWAACGAKENGLLWVVGVITYARATNPKKRAGRSGFWGAVALLTVLWIGTLSEAPPSSRLHSQLVTSRGLRRLSTITLTCTTLDNDWTPRTAARADASLSAPQRVLSILAQSQRSTSATSPGPPRAPSGMCPWGTHIRLANGRIGRKPLTLVPFQNRRAHGRTRRPQASVVIRTTKCPSVAMS